VTIRIKDKDNHFDKLCALLQVLRDECPWDREQSLASLRRYTLEEAHEVLEAIDIAVEDDDWKPLQSELGDILFHVAFYAHLADEADQFNLGDVIDALVEKMIFRHPHVFDKVRAENLTEQWNQLKDSEHAERTSLMDGIPPLPALKYSQKQQQRAARVGFDWNNAADVIGKMREELDELEAEVLHHSDISRLEDEFGDVLFTLANLARKLGLDAELCLMHTNRKFGNRFRFMEALADEMNASLESMDIKALEGLYAKAKRSEHEPSIKQST